MITEPNLLELKMSPGAFRAKAMRVANLDFEPLEVEVASLVPWLRTNLARFRIQPGKQQSLRIDIYIPAGEPAERMGKILLLPERGKPVTVDIIVSEYKRKGREK